MTKKFNTLLLLIQDSELPQQHCILGCCFTYIFDIGTLFKDHVLVQSQEWDAVPLLVPTSCYTGICFHLERANVAPDRTVTSDLMDCSWRLFPMFAWSLFSLAAVSGTRLLGVWPKIWFFRGWLGRWGLKNYCTCWCSLLALKVLWLN